MFVHESQTLKHLIYHIAYSGFRKQFIPVKRENKWREWHIMAWGKMSNYFDPTKHS